MEHYVYKIWKGCEKFDWIELSWGLNKGWVENEGDQ